MSLFKYFLAGSLCALVDIGLFASLVYLFRASWFAAAIISFSCATLVNLVLSKRYVFRSGHKFSSLVEALLVYAASGVGLIFNQFMLYIQIIWLGSHLMVAKIAATIAVFGWNYTTRRYFIFGSPR